MEKDLEKALVIGELVEVCDFILRLIMPSIPKGPKLQKKLMKKVEARDPVFMESLARFYAEHNRTPIVDWKFFMDFVYWSISNVRDKHRDIWNELVKAHPHHMSQIDDILASSGFLDE